MQRRKVIGFPLGVLWFKGQDIPARRLRDISRDEADALIMENGADIVIAQVGAPLLWPERKGIRLFWKRTTESGYYHTARSHDEVLDKSKKPNCLFYASEWEPLEEFPVVLLEMACWPYDPSLEMF